VTAESRLPGPVPCADRANHRPAFPDACPWCRSDAMCQPGAPVLIVRELVECPRGHRGQHEGWPCTVCAGETKGPDEEPSRPWRPNSGQGRCKFGMRHGVNRAGEVPCTFCRQAAAGLLDPTLERTLP